MLEEKRKRKPQTTPADLIGCRLTSVCVFVGEGPIEGGDVDTAASLVHQIHPRLEDGWMSGAGVKLQAFGNALHQHDPGDREEWESFFLNVQRQEK